MSKVKQILAGVLSASMIVTLMPAVTFAADDTAKWTYTVAGSETPQEATSYADAVSRVSAEGTVAASDGVINNSIVINVNKDFVLDVSGATLADGVTVSAANVGTGTDPDIVTCLEEKEAGKYTYLYEHEISEISAVATEASPTTTADAILVDKNGHVIYATASVDSSVAPIIDGNVTTYTGKVTASTDGSFKYIADSQTGVKYLVDAASYTVTWTVESSATTIYKIDGSTIDYVKDGQGLAVKDGDSVVFTANYQASSDNGSTWTTVIGDDGKAVVINGTVVKAAQKLDSTGYTALLQDANTSNYWVGYGVVTLTDLTSVETFLREREGLASTDPAVAYKEATANAYGNHVYTVKFAIPGTTKEETWGIGGVIDEAKLAGQTDGVDHFEVLYKNAAGTEWWHPVTSTTSSYDLSDWTKVERGLPYVWVTGSGDNRAETTTAPADADKEDQTYYLALGASDEITYRPVFKSTKTGETIDGTAETWTKVTGTSGSKDYDCGAKLLKYGNAKTVSYQRESTGAIDQYTLTALDDLVLLGTHDFDNRANWAVSFAQTTLSHDALTSCSGVACKYCGAGVAPASGAPDFNDVVTASDDTRANHWTLSSSTYTYWAPKSSDHVLITEDDSTTAKATTVDATCVRPGFTYNECSIFDNGWVAENATAPVAHNYKYDFTIKGSYKYTFYANVATSGTTATIYDQEGNVVEASIPVATTAKIAWHPVLVAGSVTPLGNHKYYVSNVAWGTNAASLAAVDFDTANVDVYASVQKTCMYEPASAARTFIYHSMTLADFKKTPEGATAKYEDDGSVIATSAGTYLKVGINVFDGVTYDVTEGADCSKKDKIVYKIEGVTDADGNAITSNAIESIVYYGPHTYTNTVTFSDDGKTANVLQQCSFKTETAQCAGKKTISGDTKVKSVPATVTSVDNADGSTTYTAIVLGMELTNNTKTLFDLTKATIVVNEGNDIDLNTIDNDNTTSATDLTTARTELTARTVVTINGVNIPAVDENDPTKVNWTLDITGPNTDHTLAVGNNNITISPVKGRSAGETKLVVKAVKPAEFNVLNQNITFDGVKKSSTKGDYLTTKTYDGDEHEMTASAVDSVTSGAVAATVEYAVVEATVTNVNTAVIPNIYTYSFYDANGIKRTVTTAGLATMPANYTLSYDSDDAKMTDAGTYLVLAQFSADGYTTKAFFLDVITIAQVDLEDIVYVTITNPTIIYGEQINATTGDAATDELIGLEVADTTKLGVGEYVLANTRFITWSKNYDVSTNWTNAMTIKVNPRAATVNVKGLTKTYDGKEVVLDDSLYTTNNVLEGDTLNVTLEVVNGETPIDVGTYELLATTNNANYDVTVTKGTITINPASIAKATVTLAKTSMKYTGKALKPAVKSVVLDGETLAASNYTVKYANNKNVGTATVTVTGKGNYTGSAKATFKITKAANPIKVTAVKRTAKAATLKTKAVTVAGIKVTGAQGKVTYRKAKGGSKFTVNKTTGKITIKKGVKAGTYKVTESAQAAGNSNYKKSKVKKAVVTITVK